MAFNDFNNKRILGTVPVEADGSAYFAVPADSPRLQLRGRHGSLTPDEMLVPMLTFTS